MQKSECANIKLTLPKQYSIYQSPPEIMLLFCFILFCFMFDFIFAFEE